VAAVAYWLVYAAREVKGWRGVAVKTASTALLAGLLVFVPAPGWFWLVPLGLAFGALGDLFLALRQALAFVAGMAAFGIGHLCYGGAFVLRSEEIGWGQVTGSEGAASLVLLALVLSTEVWMAPRAGELRWPARIYVVLIFLMGLSVIHLADHPGKEVLQLGAGLFVASDLLLAVQLFVLTSPAWQRRFAFVLWPMYWAGQALIAWGAVAFWGPGLV
jgi:uncharacterized membrane protein YhhN